MRRKSRRLKGRLVICDWCGNKKYKSLGRIKKYNFCSPEHYRLYLSSDKNKDLSKGWKHTDESKEKITQANLNRDYDVIFTKEVRQKLAEGARNKVWTKESKEKTRQSHLGKKHTKEEIQKIKANAKYGKDNYSWKGGRPKCIDCGKQLVVYTAKRCPSCTRKVQFTNKRPTSIERILYKFLESNHIIFDKQKLIGDKFIVDAYIPSLNLIIEADGGYWHSLDRVVKKDKAENAYLIKCGYNLLRLTEKNILSGEYKRSILKCL